MNYAAADLRDWLQLGILAFIERHGSPTQILQGMASQDNFREIDSFTFASKVE
jgi:hypothetical protein